MGLSPRTLRRRGTVGEDRGLREVTTEMLVAGNVTVTNEMVVEELKGKILRGALVDGGEIIMRGQGETLTPYNQQFASSVDSWTGYREDTATGTRGPFSFTRTGSGDASYIYSPTYTGGAYEYVYLSAHRDLSVTTAGKKTITVNVSPIGGMPSATLTRLSVNGGVLKQEKNISGGNTLTIVGETYSAISAIDVMCMFQSTSSFTCSLRVNSVTVTVDQDTSSYVRLFRDSSGAPTLNLADANGVVRASLSTKGDFVGMTLIGADQSVTLDQSGISGVGGLAPFGTVNWASVIRAASATPRCLVTKNPSWPYSIGSGPVTAIPVSSISCDFDWTEGHFGNDSNGIVIKVPGVYLASATVGYSANNNGRRGAGVLVNGDTTSSAALTPTNTVGSFTAQSPATQLRLAEGDIVRPYAQQESGAVSRSTSSPSSSCGLATSGHNAAGSCDGKDTLND